MGVVIRRWAWLKCIGVVSGLLEGGIDFPILLIPYYLTCFIFFGSSIFSYLFIF